MKQTICLLFLFIGIQTINAQDYRSKELTLYDAVMQQYRGFYPDQINGFNWIPDTDCYSMMGPGYQSLLKASVRDTSQKEIVNITTINEKLDAQLYYFSGFEWKNENEFWLNNGSTFYTYNLVEESGKMILDLDENAENTHFHPGTEQVAYTIDNNLFLQYPEGENIAVTNNKDKNIVSGQAIARSEFGITNGIFWSPNGNLLAFYQKDESDVHDYPILDITETPGQLKNVKYPMAGQLSEKPKVGVYNLTTKKTVFISPQGAQDDYLTNLSWTPDNKFILIAEVNRDQNHMKLNLYDAINGSFIKTLFEEKSDKWVEPEHPAFFPNKDNNNFVWITEKSGFNNLYYYNIEGELIKQLTDHKFVVKDIVDFNNGDLYYSTTGQNPLETQVYFINIKKGKTKILTRAKGTHTVKISSDGKNFYDHFSSSKAPSADWMLNKNGTINYKMLEAEDKLLPYKIGTSEISTIKATDGTTLYTRLIKPSNFDASKKYPVLVYVYGGPHAQLITNSWLDGASLWMYWMAEQGYLVYTVDGRGSAERGFEFESQIHRQLGKVEIEDQLAGVDYLKSLAYVDGDRLAVHGWSFGGFMTTSLMLKSPDVFNVGVAGGPVTDWKYYEIMYGERYMDRPDQNEKGYHEASLLTHAEKLKGDLLLIHGTSDDVVVMQHNLALVKKFVEYGLQMDFFPYPMHLHNVRGKDRVHLMTKVLNYVIENNK